VTLTVFWMPNCFENVVSDSVECNNFINHLYPSCLSWRGFYALDLLSCFHY
jgi:hypothetical protein